MKNAALADYRKKRDFNVTPEPPARAAKPAREPIFVFQEHHGSWLHYVFRLEADGVLKSWAVPKQPSTDPSVRRLAVQVEDHPLAYANFSGQIPKGEYGAGTVKIWDKGTYENLLEKKPERRTLTEAIREGRVEIRLHGRKLSGRFALVRMKVRGKKADWLLIKMRDGEAQGKSNSIRSHTRVKKRQTDQTPRSTKKPGASQSSLALEFSHEEKTLFPVLGITKGDVLRFYERVAERLIPHLRDRPMTLERLPDGLQKGGPHFWQKNTPTYYPSWIPRIMIESEDGEQVDCALVNDEKTLLYMVNQGTLTFHPWLSRVGSLDRPDFVLFDLDPGKASFEDLVTAAKTLHQELTHESFDSFIKTSGKTGLHVLVPWKGSGDYDETRQWAGGFAERIVELLPGITTTERSKPKRRGRVYLDTLQNVRGHHVVPPYVLRVPHATVSTPLRWTELSSGLDPQKYNIKTIFQRLARLRDDPMAPLVKLYR